ncbi:hypothetical protein CYME_CMQ114C [Cyanidioschyzon merolae strain 10D]|jgi:hypothetical protein|uniref:Uncharacterized protein n=1 Tax=Cyanidioschyzon merolae (strain NIES-3377 / 10D) TaxID=280699 RepID=M1V6A8_CYAM1|nr:hypothetical protein CYME_CMQ114C [Cyanidioschyzon merolae strain 10D]BAM82025.1 hypothetical protein CYME_CMQ114C [Cyanidioschyzon merolae strain 10D]|eukprot:XP_005538061.1 hypothetical protein CYME_CMQ114C [Cyanidioschyzon merolae strain 10D]
MLHRVKLSLKSSKDAVLRRGPASAPETRYEAAMDVLDSLERRAQRVRAVLAANENAWKSLLANMSDATGSIQTMFEATHPFYSTATDTANVVSALEQHMCKIGLLRPPPTGYRQNESKPTPEGVQSVLAQVDEFLEKCKEMRKRAHVYEERLREVNYYLTKVEKLEAAQKQDSDARLERNRLKLLESRQSAEDACNSLQLGVEMLERNKDVVFSRALIVYISNQLAALKFEPLIEQDRELQDIMTEHGSLTSQKIDWTESSQVNTSGERTSQRMQSPTSKTPSRFSADASPLSDSVDHSVAGGASPPPEFDPHEFAEHREQEPEPEGNLA